MNGEEKGLRSLRRIPQMLWTAIFNSRGRISQPSALGRRWLAVASTALMMGAYATQAVVPAAEASPAPIAGIAPSYGPRTVSAVPNAAAIVRRIWLPELDAGYDPQGLAGDDGVLYVSAYRRDDFGGRWR